MSEKKVEGEKRPKNYDGQTREGGKNPPEPKDRRPEPTPPPPPPPKKDS